MPQRSDRTPTTHRIAPFAQNQRIFRIGSRDDAHVLIITGIAKRHHCDDPVHELGREALEDEMDQGGALAVTRNHEPAAEAPRNHHFKLLLELARFYGVAAFGHRSPVGPCRVGYALHGHRLSQPDL